MGYKIRVLAIDAGLEGGHVVFDAARPLDPVSVGVHPVLPGERLNQFGGRTDIKTLFSRLQELRQGVDELAVVCECDAIRVAKNIKSMIWLRDSLMHIATCVELVGGRWYPVRSCDWKKSLKVTSDKAKSLKLCRELFPHVLVGNDDNVAEALLIGYWAFSVRELFRGLELTPWSPKPRGKIYGRKRAVEWRRQDSDARRVRGRPKARSRSSGTKGKAQRKYK